MVDGTCPENACTRPVKARGRCASHYNVWLATAPSEDKVPRYDWPSDDELVALFQEHYSLTKVARSLGRVRETLRARIEHRPELEARVRPYYSPTPEMRAERQRVAKARKRANDRVRRRENPERVREINRKWARGRSPETVRKYNRRSAERRAAQLEPLTDSELAERIKWMDILHGDPCAYCGASFEHGDHIQAVNTGGNDRWDNLTASCASCNFSKRDKSVLDFMLWKLDRAA